MARSSTIAFSSQGRRKVQADFAGGSLTSDAGAMLIREIDRRLGLTEAICRCIRDPRDPDSIIHTQLTLLRQRILAILLGYEDLNDHETLRKDPVFQVFAERVQGTDEPPASPPTRCRLENPDQKSVGQHL